MSFVNFLITYWYIGIEILWVLWTLYHSIIWIRWLYIQHTNSARWYWHVDKMRKKRLNGNSMEYPQVFLFLFGWLNIVVLILKFIF